ncbi:MAG TPA: ATP-binding protein [Thermoanaerobaculia bacterium]|jgi:nitrogen fixation/metabolism regulation signal transduction histidine kinase
MVKRVDRIILLAVAATCPSLVALGVLLFPAAASLRWAVATVALVATVLLIRAVQRNVVYPLRTVSSFVGALREGDYSVRLREPKRADAIGELTIEFNKLAGQLHGRRLGGLEATALLETVIRETEVAMFAFDAEQRLRLVNPAGQRLLGAPGDDLLGRGAADLELLCCMESDEPTIDMSFAGKSGRFGVRRSTFREGGHRHTLLAITDLSQVLRDEELQAWIRLVRVLSHELNNSLTPIRSIARTLLSLGSREPTPAGWQEDVKRGLEVIASRAESLARFTEAYSKLARLPTPHFRPVDAGALVEHAARLEDRIRVTVSAGPHVTIEADADQLEQLIINIVRNAADASMETGGSVQISWTADDRALEIAIADEGHGVASGANLFVPFYTTKPRGTGTGIGLVLSRQIAEAHGGTLTLENRGDRTGCIARLRLPLPKAG